MKWSDNEEAQKEYEEEVRNAPMKKKLKEETEREIYTQKIKEKEKAMRKIWEEDAKLRKKDRNRRDYIECRNEKLDYYINEIYYLELAMKSRFRDVSIYRTSTPSCFAINKPFNGCVKHHIDKDTIVHIPKSLHLLVKHNLKTGKGMKEINENVYRWLRQKSNISNPISERTITEPCE